MFDFSLLHPMIVHFPIALLIVGFLFETIGLFVQKEFFSKTGFYLLILGTIGVITAYFTGRSAGAGITEVGTLKQALETHEGAAVLSLWLIAGAALVRIAFVLLKKYYGIFKGIAFALFLLGVLSIARTGYFGGELVFKHAAGVQLNLGLDIPAETSDSNLNKDKSSD